MSIAAVFWRNLIENEKQRFIELAAEDKERWLNERNALAASLVKDDNCNSRNDYMFDLTKLNNEKL